MPTRPEFDDLSAADAAFARRARAQLRASEALDWTTTMRLQAARARAVSSVRPSATLPSWVRWAAPVALVAVVAGVLLNRHEARVVTAPSVASAVNLPAVDALEWATDEAGPGFYRDLEFYEWLERRSLSRPNA